MNRRLLGAGLLALGATAMAADVGVSVSIGQPDFYGRIDIGNFPPPRVIYPQPVIVAPPPQYVARAPIYLRVPPGHAKKWSKHCAAYNACGQPVLFVEDSWYVNDYAPRYLEQQGYASAPDHPGHGHGKGHGKGKGHDRD